MKYIGITERGDAALDLSWLHYVNNGGYAILISKDPIRLIESINTNCNGNTKNRIIIHATITGMAGSELEPNVPKLDEGTFESLLTNPGGSDVAKKVLRVDPIIPTPDGTELAISVINKWASYFDEVRISFIDNYYHIRDRGVKLPWDSLHAPYELRKESYSKILNVCLTLNKPLFVCGEPGFPCNGCVSLSDMIALGINEPCYTNAFKQRTVCHCIMQKYELLKNRHPCAHNCQYCYWKD